MTPFSAGLSFTVLSSPVSSSKSKILVGFKNSSLISWRVGLVEGSEVASAASEMSVASRVSAAGSGWSTEILVVLRGGMNSSG